MKMNKWLGICVSFLLVLSIAVIYLWIPSTVNIYHHLRVRGNVGGTARYLSDERNWRKWDPMSVYSLGRRLSHVNEVMIRSEDTTVMSSWMGVVAANAADSIDIEWQLSVNTGASPIGRIRQYRAAQLAGRRMAGTLVRLRDFIADEEVYGIAVKQVASSDSFLLIKRVEMSAEPSTQQLYALFGDLKAFGIREGVRKTGYPMVNVTPLARDRLEVEIALPIDREIPNGKDILFRRLPLGQFLMTEVKGGPGKVRDALGQMQNYVMDHQRTVMAIPFESLVTDRSAEPDTSRWVTKIFYPIY